TGLLGAVGLGLLTVVALAAQAQEPTARPRLLVLVVFDQMRGDYLERWHDLFSQDGFRRLEREGTWFTNCHYPYSYTQTGPGHASLSTGCSPNRHGIVGNEWFDRAEGATVHCTTHSRYQPVYSHPLLEEPKKKSDTAVDDS